MQEKKNVKELVLITSKLIFFALLSVHLSFNFDIDIYIGIIHLYFL